ncbi:cell division protein ZapE [Roseomonas alkaliterrae]|jgi:cell division protein ZapE|uniref:Cell division protein ZapE n=1 Tax=Neoroseomonas alkaliterrae TaxID=1452450 RepID=A0A840XQF2_9PROT|nr:cell division protein ZapE [Neoroseomonas alkaliterrae]MBB5690795.1 cell division protein ZapE [Neoroseomonas alkaliterrae]MBR0675770.1 cell division protein ZapE [Neoroseomonas alkaliterrae]
MTPPPDAAPPGPSLSAPSDGPLPALRARIAAGLIARDPAQELAAEKLQDLWRRTRGYDPKAEPPETGGFLSRFLRRKPVEEAPEGAPLGLYLVGEVGRGKSMLMDLFFASAEVPRKKRLHFHQFMQQAHRRIHAWKQQHGDTADPIPPLADSIVAEAALLCFDEFQVHDIADAMILGRLFEALFARGVVVVATSNTAPDDLFKGKPGRDAFLPFIALIKKRIEVLVLESARDYRRERIRGLPTWHVPPDGRAERALDAAFAELTGDTPAKPTKLTLLGRAVEVPQAARGVARFEFDDICGKPLGPADYLAVATHFHTLVIDGIPRLGPENFDKARRFITLIDALYEHRVKLVASAEDHPDRLYERGENAAMFERTASRLMEMQSQDYLALPHLT